MPKSINMGNQFRTSTTANTNHAPRPLRSSTDTQQRVTIIGAGAAGLATAIFIHDSCKAANRAIPEIDIYEATDRAGGRVYTYQFTDSADEAVHNYYDIGAMRIPEIVTMDR